MRVLFILAGAVVLSGCATTRTAVWYPPERRDRPEAYPVVTVPRQAVDEVEVRTPEWWAKREQENREADVVLSRKLIICKC